MNVRITDVLFTLSTTSHQNKRSITAFPPSTLSRSILLTSSLFLSPPIPFTQFTFATTVIILHSAIRGDLCEGACSIACVIGCIRNQKRGEEFTFRKALINVVDGTASPLLNVSVNFALRKLHLEPRWYGNKW
ncbi:hypothetical protein Trydic_g23310 [Trypoxylus dichotomus]